MLQYKIYEKVQFGAFWSVSDIIRELRNPGNILNTVFFKRQFYYIFIYLIHIQFYIYQTITVQNKISPLNSLKMYSNLQNIYCVHNNDLQTTQIDKLSIKYIINYYNSDINYVLSV